MGGQSHQRTPQQAPESDTPDQGSSSWWDNSFLQSLLGSGSSGGANGVAGAAGREGAVQSIHQSAYDMGYNAPRSNFNGDIYRNVGSNYANSMFEAQHGANWGGRYNASGQQLIYTSPSLVESVGETSAYNGMANRTMVRANYNTAVDPVTGVGGVADVTTAAANRGMTNALKPHVGNGGPGWLYDLTGEHPYSMTQQVGKGATDSGAGAARMPSATGGNQIDIIPRNNNAGSITPLEVTPYDAHGNATGTRPAGTSIKGMGLDTSPHTPGPIEFEPGSRIRPNNVDPKAGGRSSSARYGAIGGGAMALGTDLWRMGQGEDIGFGQVAADTGVGTAMGAGSALAFDALVAGGRSAAGAGGIIGGVLEGGMSAWNNANAYSNGDISGGQAVANTVVDTGVGVGAGAAGAAIGAAIGSIIPGAGTAVGAGLGFLGGMAGSYIVHALADKTGAAGWAKEQLGAGLDWAGEGLSTAGGAIADGAGALWDGAKGVGSSIADGAGAAWEGAKGVGSNIANGAGAAWEGAKGVGSNIANGAGAAWEGAKNVGSNIADGAGAVWDTLTGW